MNKKQVLEELIRSGIVAVIRMCDSQKLLKACETLYRGGIRAMEITLTTPDPFRAIGNLAGMTGKWYIAGAGTVLTRADAFKQTTGGDVNLARKKDILAVARGNVSGRVQR